MDVIFYDKDNKVTGRGSYSNPAHIPKQYPYKEVKKFKESVASPEIIEVEKIVEKPVEVIKEIEEIIIPKKNFFKKIWDFLNKPL